MYYRTLSEVVADYRAWATSDHPRVGTGYDILDSRTNGGAAEGEVILFQARSQVGKTTFAMNVIDNNRDLPTVFFSLEMAARYVAHKLAAIATGTPTSQIEQELRQHGESRAINELSGIFPRLVIVDDPRLGLKQMDRALDEIEDVWEEKTKLVVIDYLELIGGVPSLSAVEKVDQVAMRIKDFARLRDVVVLVLHQVGRGEGGEGARPLAIDSGRYGGEAQADYVLSAYRPCLRSGITQEEYEKECWWYYLQFLKTRGGAMIHPQGKLHYLNPYTLKIYEEEFFQDSFFDPLLEAEVGEVA